jgi:hypothetical protein
MMMLVVVPVHEGDHESPGLPNRIEPLRKVRPIKGGAIMDHETPLERRFVAVEK